MQGSWVAPPKDHTAGSSTNGHSIGYYEHAEGLHFLENHDEQRIASPAIFWDNAS